MKQKIEDLFSAAAGEMNIVPVVSIDTVQKLNDSELPETLPILALRNAVLFPSTVTPISIGREKSIKLVRDVYKSSKILGAISQRDIGIEDPSLIDLYNIGTLARIIKIIEMPDGTITAIAQEKRQRDEFSDRLHQGSCPAYYQAFPSSSVGGIIRNKKYRR